MRNILEGLMQDSGATLTEKGKADRKQVESVILKALAERVEKRGKVTMQDTALMARVVSARICDDYEGEDRGTRMLEFAERVEKAGRDHHGFAAFCTELADNGIFPEAK